MDQQEKLDIQLIKACENGSLEKVKKLVEQGADIRGRNDEALLYATINGNLNVVKYLIENGVDIHTQDNKALMYASIHGYLDIVKYLVEKGMDIQIALNSAKEKQQEGVVNWCESYIESKKLNDKLEKDLNFDKTNKKKMKI